MEKNNEYVYPKIDDYIKDKNVISAYKSFNDSPFVSMNENGKIKCVSLKTFPNILLYGINEDERKEFIKNILFNIMLKSSPIECKFIIVHEYLEYSELKPTPHSLNYSNFRGDSLNSIIAAYKIINERNEMGINNIDSYNEYARKKDKEILPYICLVIDKLDNILLSENREDVDSYIREIARLGRAVGVFIVLSVGTLNNSVISDETISYFSTRVSFKAHSKLESMKLLDHKEAVELNNNEFYINSAFNGFDGLYSLIDIDKEAYNNLINYVSSQPRQEDIKVDIEESESQSSKDSSDEEYDDPLYNEIVEFVVEQGKASASLLQRRFRLGYNRAARVIDLLEERGVIGPAEGNSKPREVLIKKENDTNIDDQELIESNNYQNNDNNIETNNYKSYNGVQKQRNRDSNRALFEMIMGLIMFGIVLYALVIAISH